VAGYVLRKISTGNNSRYRVERLIPGGPEHVDDAPIDDEPEAPSAPVLAV